VVTCVVWLSPFLRKGLLGKRLGIWTLDWWFSKNQRISQITYPEPLVLHQFFEKTGWFFDIFVKYRELAIFKYFQILFKCKIWGFFDFEHSQKPRTGGDNKIKEPVLCTCGPE
jgi:hypothetical protein